MELTYPPCVSTLRSDESPYMVNQRLDPLQHSSPWTFITSLPFYTFYFIISTKNCSFIAFSWLFFLKATFTPPVHLKQGSNRSPRIVDIVTFFFHTLLTHSLHLPKPIIIKIGWQCNAGRERLTPYQSEDPSPSIPTQRWKKRKGKQSETKGNEQLGQ